jgi:hypothetical protein
VPELRCPTCGRTFVTKTGSHRFCTPTCRERARSRARPSAAKYGAHHRRAREKWLIPIAAGGVPCARCGIELVPGEKWDLGHDDDDPSLYAGPEHAACNRAAGARASARQAYVDDPTRGVFWGPPDETGKPRRWSRPWYPWRSAA